MPPPPPNDPVPFEILGDLLYFIILLGGVMCLGVGVGVAGNDLDEATMCYLVPRLGFCRHVGGNNVDNVPPQVELGTL